jgi:hypothetical protein
MRHRTGLLGLGAGLALGATLITAAIAATLDVKPGLWEITSQGEASGMPPIPPQALANMSPQQREQIMAAMAGAMARANQPNVTRSCITQKMIERGWEPNQDHRGNCSQTRTSSTSSSLDARMVCTGEQQATGNLHIDALDRETIRGTFNMVMTGGSNTMTMKRTLQGKWLGGDCGDVKPHGE